MAINFQLAEFSCSYGTGPQLKAANTEALPEFVFSGRSNVGKSTLINKLAGRKALARVSSMPGKTTTINFFSLKECFLVDLPGYGYAKRSQEEKRRWSNLLDGYFDGSRPVAMIFQLIDFRHPPTADDFQMLQYLDATGLPFTVVLTKSDKLNKSETAARHLALENELKDFSQLQKIPFSSVTAAGVEDLRSIIISQTEAFHSAAQTQ